MLRKVSGSAAIYLSRLARAAEVFDEIFAFLHFLILQFKDCTDTFKGERFNQKELEQQLRRSDSFAQMMARSELDSGVKRPLLPLSISQIGLIGGSGMINGLIECDTPHIIKGRIIKVVRTESEEKFNYRGDHMGSEIKETISNKMIFNVLTPNGFKALT